MGQCPNGHIDPNTNGSEVEGGLYSEELITRYPLIVTKCNSLRGTIAEEGLPVGPAPRGPSSRCALIESSVACIGNYTGRSRRAESQDPLLLRQEGRSDNGPGPPQIYPRIQKSTKTQHTIQNNQQQLPSYEQANMD